MLNVSHISRLKSKLTNFNNNMKQQETLLLLKALAFAADKHRFQTRKDKAGTPYINHPINVALTLSEVGNEDNIQLLTAAAS